MYVHIKDTYRSTIASPTHRIFNEKDERHNKRHYFPLLWCNVVLVVRSHYSSARAAIIVIIIGCTNPVDCWQSSVGVLLKHEVVSLAYCCFFLSLDSNMPSLSNGLSCCFRLFFFSLGMFFHFGTCFRAYRNGFAIPLCQEWAYLVNRTFCLASERWNPSGKFYSPSVWPLIVAAPRP